MDISFATPRVNVANKTGYGYATSCITKSLTDLGHTVYYQDPKPPVQINFAQAFQYKLHRNQYQISYTPWESTQLPESWWPNINYVDEVWTTSDWCANVFESNGLKNVKVYPHGIDPIWKPKRREDDGVIKFLHVGEPAPRKAGQLVVEAFIKLFGNNPKYQLTIKAWKENSTRIYNNTIDRNIVGLPNQLYSNINIIYDEVEDDELVKIYYDHDVLVYPSYGEGFGFIPLQALATGMPVICVEEWCHYKKFLGPLSLKSRLIDSPWSILPGQVLEPDYKHLLDLMMDVSLNFKAYSGYYYAQSTKIHEEYNWNQLTNNSFSHIFNKFI
jgi:hypothetical protein